MYIVSLVVLERMVCVVREISSCICMYIHMYIQTMYMYSVFFVVLVCMASIHSSYNLLLCVYAHTYVYMNDVYVYRVIDRLMCMARLFEKSPVICKCTYTC